MAFAKDDSLESHVNDTLYAGCGHNDVTAVRHLLKSGQTMINRLIEGHFPFDTKSDGTFCLGREGAHSKRRILHAGGDATGRMLVELNQHPSGRISPGVQNPPFGMSPFPAETKRSVRLRIKREMAFYQPVYHGLSAFQQMPHGCHVIVSASRIQCIVHMGF